MIKPNIIPRTLRGIGGIRLFDLPGVIYPKEVLVAKPGFNRKDGRPYKYTPGWGLTTRESAKLLGTTPSAARSWLHRRNVPYRIVGETGGILRLYWQKARVQTLANARLPIAPIKFPKNLISAEETRRRLQVARSTLARYEKNGRLRVVRMRARTSKGLRSRTFYHLTEVEHLADYLKASRQLEQKLLLLFNKKTLNPTSPARKHALAPKRHALTTPTPKEQNEK